jgi:hypothetical protein
MVDIRYNYLNKYNCRVFISLEGKGCLFKESLGFHLSKTNFSQLDKLLVSKFTNSAIM